MKTLFGLLILALVLAGGYWKTQHPEATVDDLRNQATATIDRLKGGLTAVREGGGTASGKQQQITAEQQALQTRLAALEDDLAQTSIDNNTVLERVDALNGRLDLMTRQREQDTVAEDVAAVDQRLDALDASVTQLLASTNSRQTELLSDLSTMGEKTDSLEARVDTLSSSPDDTDESTPAATLNAPVDLRLAQIEKKLATTNADSRQLQSLTEQINDITQNIAALDTRLKNTKAPAATSNPPIQSSGETASIDTLQTDISEQLEALQTQVENSGKSTDVESLISSLEATSDRIQTLEQRVQELPASSNEADSAQQMQNALQSQIAALEKRLSSTFSQPDPALLNSIAEVKKQVDQLASQSFVTREELQAKQKGRNIKYKIYFERNSTAVTEEAAKVLNSFIAQEQNRTTGVSIYGFTDRIGSAVYNQQLAQQRATNVRSYLIQNGFDYTRIKAVSGLGEDAAAAIQEDEQVDAQQRSVVLFAAQP